MAGGASEGRVAADAALEPGPGHRYDCDEILVPRRWVKLLHTASVPAGATWRALSDHNPVVVEIERPGHSAR